MSAPALCVLFSYYNARGGCCCAAAVAAAAEVKRSSSKEKHISFNTLPYKYITDKLLVISTASCHALVNKNPLWCAAAAHTHSQSVSQFMSWCLGCCCVLRAARQRTSISLQKRISTRDIGPGVFLEKLHASGDFWWFKIGACRHLRAFLCLIFYLKATCFIE